MNRNNLTKKQIDEKYDEFESELKNLIGQHHMEQFSNTPDRVLSKYLVRCLRAFDSGVVYRNLLCGTETATETKGK